MENQTLTGRADLHMHTLASDGTTSARAMLDHAARRCNLDVVAITDHDCLDASLWAVSQQGVYPFDIVPGVEVTSADGHVLALWVSVPIPMGMSLRETAAAIHEQSGIAVLAHPFEPTIAPHTLWRYLRHPEVLLQAGIDAVEVYNAGAITPGCNWLAQQVFSQIDIPVVGNSDAHMPASIATGVTYFGGRTAAELRAALTDGHTLAEGKSWPLTVYLRLSVSYIQQKLSGSLATSASSTRLTTL